MIEYKTADIFDEDAEALVVSVNCVGVMGRGIALQFKKRFPANFRAYEDACKRGEVQPGRMFVYETGSNTNPRYIINFPTKRHWRGKSRLEDIEAGLQALVEEIKSRHIRSIAIPPLGSDLGGLDWPKVRTRIDAALRGFDDLAAVVMEVGSSPSDRRPNRSTNVPRMTKGRAALIALIDRYLRGLAEPFLTLLEIHKLMYFMQEANEPLRLRFQQGTYGPYAENLRHVLHVMEGHLISGYSDGGDAPFKILELLPGALEDARSFLAKHPETEKRMDRVANLVEGFESPVGLELLATVHWVANKSPDLTGLQVIDQTHAWNERKQQLSGEKIRLALDVLRQKGWLGQPPDTA